MTCLYPPPPNAQKKDILYCNIPKGLPQLINGRLRKICERWDIRMIPALQWSSNKQSKVEVEWPDTLKLPGSI